MRLYFHLISFLPKINIKSVYFLIKTFIYLPLQNVVTFYFAECIFIIFYESLY